MATLSNEWLGSVLACTVVSFHTRTLQEGITTGHLKKVEVESESGEKMTVVVKETRSGAEGKQLSQVLGLPRESLFYRSFASKLEKRDIAKVYHASGSLESGETLIVMEDLSRGVQSGYFFGPGNPMNWGKDLESAVAKGNGASARKIAKEAFVLAARLHGQFFCSQDLIGHDWLKGSMWIAGKDEARWISAQKQTRELWEPLKKTIEEGKAGVQWSTEVVDVIEASVGQASDKDAWARFLASIQNKPYTLLHGDFHPGNMIYLPDDGDDKNGDSALPGSLKLVDWEMVGVGSGPQDLAQYMISHATPALRRECERELLAAYHKQLTETAARIHGPAVGSNPAVNYAFAQCEADYVSGGVGKWVWLMIQMGGGMQLPGAVMQYFHDQLKAFILDHGVTAASGNVPPPRV